MLAATVFAHAMRYFGKCCLQELQEQTTSPAVTVEDIQWVITVPAIWRQSAKQFMRHAALQVSLQTLQWSILWYVVWFAACCAGCIVVIVVIVIS